MDRSVDNWDTYARLVLAELERHNGLLVAINEKLDTIRLQQVITEREVSSVSKDLATFKKTSQKMSQDHEERLEQIEERDLVSETIKRYKKWLIVMIFTVISSFIIPIVDLIMKIRG